MKLFIFSVILVLLVGCSSTAIHDPFEVKVPVYTKPKIERIPRPPLLSDGLNSKSYSAITKMIKVDLESLKTYSIMLENQLNTIVDYE